jgi:transcription initiation factor TFIIIB Brf1 subunit/transcription initiation factor TFIIB
LFNLAQVYHTNDSKISLDYINRFSNSLNLPDDEEDRIASVLLRDLLTYENSM